MENLSDLPPTALIALGITLAVMIGVRFLGLRQGVLADPAKSSGTTVAAVIVDPTALNNATAALNRHTDALQKASGDICKSIDDLRQEMQINRAVDQAIGRQI